MIPGTVHGIIRITIVHGIITAPSTMHGAITTPGTARSITITGIARTIIATIPPFITAGTTIRTIITTTTVIMRIAGIPVTEIRMPTAEIPATPVRPAWLLPRGQA
jgi:hypothetical protein